MLISVIVPIYNSEKYLKECIESIQRQSWSDLEIICVNDGSTDKSRAIVDRLAARDARVKTIHKANGGVSSARNTGLKAARGDYVMFVDSDDWIDAELVETAATKLLGSSNVDLVMATGSNRIYSNPGDIRELLIRTLRRETINSSCGKLYRKSLLAKKDLLFVEGLSIGEDLLFNVQFMSSSECVATMAKRMYNIRVRTGSLSRSSSPPDKYEDLRTVHTRIRDVLHASMTDELDSLLNYLWIKMLASCTRQRFPGLALRKRLKSFQAARTLAVQNGSLPVTSGDIVMRSVGSIYNRAGLNVLNATIAASQLSSGVYARLTSMNVKTITAKQ